MSSCIKHRLYWVFFSGKKMNTLQLIFHIIRYSNKKYDINATNKQTPNITFLTIRSNLCQTSARTSDKGFPREECSCSVHGAGPW